MKGDHAATPMHVPSVAFHTQPAWQPHTTLVLYVQIECAPQSARQSVRHDANTRGQWIKLVHGSAPKSQLQLRIKKGKNTSNRQTSCKHERGVRERMCKRDAEAAADKRLRVHERDGVVEQVPGGIDPTLKKHITHSCSMEVSFSAAFGTSVMELLVRILPASA